MTSASRVSSAFRVHCPSFQSIVIASGGRVLARPSAEPSGLTTDTRDDPAGTCFVALAGERFDGHAFVAEAAARGAAMAIVERPLEEAAMSALPSGFGLVEVRSTRAALGQIAHAWRRSLLKLRVVGVTGSAGKTTTRRLLEGILAEAGPTFASPKSFNNDIGVPLTLLATPDEARFLVAEIGMNHPGEIEPLAELCEPEGCIVTLAGRAHLEGMGSVEAVAREKASLLQAVPEHGFAIVNGDNQPLMAAVAELVDAGRGPSRIETFGIAVSSGYRLEAREGTATGQHIHVRLPARHAAGAAADVGGGGSRVEVFELQMPGEHNAMNAVAAIGAACEMGVGIDAIRRGLRAVAPADMRLERLEVAGRTVFNDAYNANPDAMNASLAAFAELAASSARRVAILGEMRELGPGARELHEEVGRRAAATLGPADALVAVGPHAAALVGAARDAGFRGHSVHGAEFSEALAAEAALHAPVGAALLLKGSRGARMERFLEPMRMAFASA